MTEPRWLPLKEAEALLASRLANSEVRSVPRLRLRLRSHYFHTMNAHIIGDTPIRGKKVDRKWLVSASDAALAIERISTLTVKRQPRKSITPTTRQYLKWERERSHPGHPHWNVEITQAFRIRELNTLRTLHPYTIYGIDITPHIRGSAGEYSLPLTLVDLFNSAEKQQRKLLHDASRCCACKKRVDLAAFHSARRENLDGWQTICERCRETQTRQRVTYAREMHGVPYNSRTSRLESAITADKFLCVLCGGLAKIWDHCHDHGMIRGPLCGSCNQVEPILLATPSISWNISPGTGERNPTQRITPQEAITYLHNCKICADYQTLPVHHWAYLAHENLWHTKNRAQLGGCDQWTIEAPCELFRLRNYQAANALVPLLWEPPGEPHTEWICSSHHRPARPHGITSQQVRAASLEQLRVMKIAGLTPPWSI